MDSGEREQWYAVRVKPNCERTAAAALSAKGLPCSLPLYRERRRWSDRYKTVEVPLLRGYVFCQFTRGRRAAVASTPGVLYVVSCGGVPAPVDPAEIDAVQSIADCGLAAEPCLYVEAGQRVEIVGGPLAGLSGIVVECMSRQRLVVNVTLLRRAVAVEVEAGWVHATSGCGRPAPGLAPAFMGNQGAASYRSGCTTNTTKLMEAKC